ncbi:MAG: hypothetical protein MZU97_07090 [Bacillus subtilis]|nr:hypothetical protein [Bacillus subtilis]
MAFSKPAFARPFAFIGLILETAEAQGVPDAPMEQAFYLLTRLVVAAATHLVEHLFVFGFSSYHLSQGRW